MKLIFYDSMLFIPNSLLKCSQIVHINYLLSQLLVIKAFYLIKMLTIDVSYLQKIGCICFLFFCRKYFVYIPYIANDKEP